MMRLFRRILDFLVTGLFFVGLALLAAFFAGNSEVSYVGTARVLDGDSLVVDGVEMRLFGIDAPEFNQICSGDDRSQHPCGRHSRNKLRELVQGQVVCSGWQTDKFERLLAECEANGKSVNSEMVRSGWAVSFGDYEPQEADAKTNKRGIWAWSFDRPQDWRRDQAMAHSKSWLAGLKFW